MSSYENGKILIHDSIERLKRCALFFHQMPESATNNLTKSLKENLSISDKVPLKSDSQAKSESASSIVIEQYQDEAQMPEIMRMITNDLSEPYSIYTYRYFIHNWPNLCLLAYDSIKKVYVGVIVCKMDVNLCARGYIAMLAVDASSRRKGIGTQLVKEAIRVMDEAECIEVALETEVTNETALRLYNGLGFIREKRLFHYYLNGVDAFRLKLRLRQPIEYVAEMDQIPIGTDEMK